MYRQIHPLSITFYSTVFTEVMTTTERPELTELAVDLGAGNRDLADVRHSSEKHCQVGIFRPVDISQMLKTNIRHEVTADDKQVSLKNTHNMV